MIYWVNQHVFTKLCQIMMLRCLIILTIYMLPACKSSKTLLELEEQIIDMVTNEEGIFAVAFQDLNTDETILLNVHEEFHAASTMKTPVMIEAFKQAESGRFSLDDSVIIKNEFYSIVDSSVYRLTASEDSEKTLYDKIGQKRSIVDLIYDMIIVSSNLATNQVIDIVDARKVTQTMRSLGAPKIEVLRGVEDMKAYRAGLSNSTTAEDLLVIYAKLANGKVVSRRASDAMIKILLDQKFNDIIPAHLPKKVKVAHKTGVITGLHHDSGIVFLPDGRKYVLILLSKDLGDFDQGTKMMARISKLIYKYTVDRK